MDTEGTTTNVEQMEGFEQAAENLDAAMEAQGSEENGGEQGEAPTIEEILELDKHDKFKFQGHEFTPDELNNAILRQQDYTKKTQELAQERRYYENLPYDLEYIKQDPSLVDRFKATYPEKFHKFADETLDAVRMEKRDQTNDSTQGFDSDPRDTTIKKLEKELESMRSRFDEMDTKSREQQIEQTQAQLDVIFQAMEKKYPLADPDLVSAKAEAMIAKNQGQNPYFKMTDASWERLFKASHEQIEQRAGGYLNNKLKAQVEKGQNGADGGSGGAPMGRGGKPKTFDDAYNAAMAHYGQ